jgi:hypothetical protein
VHANHLQIKEEDNRSKTESGIKEKETESEYFVRAGGGGCDFCDGDGRSVGGQNYIRASDAGQLCEKLALHIHVLHSGLIWGELQTHE